jgi:hypothetical protein
MGSSPFYLGNYALHFKAGQGVMITKAVAWECLGRTRSADVSSSFPECNEQPSLQSGPRKPRGAQVLLSVSPSRIPLHFLWHTGWPPP